jgi:hypothetical protein
MPGPRRKYAKVTPQIGKSPRSKSMTAVVPEPMLLPFISLYI